MKQNRHFTGKLVYAITFILLIPAILWLWARYTMQIVRFPAIESTITGCILMIAGGLLMLWAMFVLIKIGKGLPMNAYPPPVFVSSGPYRVFRHPIYFGFVVQMIGSFIFTGSGSGLWLVTPITILGIIALVWGYEKIDLEKRFSGQKIKTVFDLPGNYSEAPKLRDYLVSLFLVVSLLFLINFIITKLAGTIPPVFGEPLKLISGLENPFLAYLSIVFIIAFPFFLKRNDLLRDWVISVIFSFFYLLFITLQYPSVGAQYLPVQGSYLFTVPVFLLFISLRAMYRQSVKTGIIFTIIVLILVIIQLSDSRSASLHFNISVLIFLFSAFYLRIWLLIKNLAEKIANSWKEWTFGKIRIINHGIYTGLGTTFIILVAGVLAGKDYTLAILICSILLTICAALWAQFIEGSEKLKRPFGYYGAVVGIVFGSIFVWVIGLNVWVVLGVASVTMPWGQALGRLRCLVNGCCHGCQVNSSIIGIRFHHHRSRVNNISGLKGELLHPTQLYSIIWLFFTGIILFTLWLNHISNPFIFGLYLVLTSLGRFVEEAYRGEAQTIVIKGLRLYQWIAVFVCLTGMIISTIKVDPVVINPVFSWESILYSAIGGLFVFIAMGVDFPYSNARFSRLV